MNVNARILFVTLAVTVPGGGACKNNKLQNQQGKLDVQDGTNLVTDKGDDFGEVCPNMTLVKQLMLVNNSLGDVEVSAISISGSAFTAQVPTLPFTVSAGGSEPLPVTFAPATTGPVAGTLTVTSDAANNPTTVNLTGTGQSGAPQPVYGATCNAATSSCSALLWEGVSVGGSSDDDLVVDDQGCPPLVIQSAVLAIADGGTGPFSMPNLPALPASVSPGTPLSIDVRYSPTSIGLDRATLTLTTNDPVNSFPAGGTPGVFVYNLSGAGLAPQVQITTCPYDFGAVNQGQTTTATFTLTDVGTEGVTLQAPTLSPSGTGFAVAFGWTPNTMLQPQGGNNSITCQVSFTSPGTGLFQDQLTVAYSSAQGGGTVSCNLIAHSSGVLCVSPDPVIVPPVQTSSVLYCAPASAPVVIGNCGNANLNVTSIGFGGANPGGTFSVTLPAGTTLPAAIPPDGGIFATVIYTDDGRHTDPGAQLLIVSDDPSAPDGGTAVSVIAEVTAVPPPGDSPAQVGGSVGVGQTTTFQAEPGDDAPVYSYAWSIVPPNCGAATLVADGGMAWVTPTASGSCNVCLQAYEQPVDGNSCGFDSGVPGNCTQFNP